MDKGPSRMAPAGTGRMVVALVVLGVLALLVWRTIDPGKVQQLAWLLLGFFAARIVLGWMRSRRIVKGRSGGMLDRLE